MQPMPFGVVTSGALLKYNLYVINYSNQCVDQLDGLQIWETNREK
jgi:hypothetical protein